MNGGMGNWNNPFIYLVWMMFANRMWGGDNGGWNNPQYAALQNQLQENQNANLVMDGIKGNSAAIAQLAQNLNCDFNTLQQCCCDVRNGISQLSGQLGFSAEKIINAGLMGDNNIISKLCECCCGINQNILNFKAENQLQNCQQTQAITAAISYDGNLTREAIQSFRQAWEQSRYTDAVAEKNRLQTVLDLQGLQQSTGSMVQAAIAPVNAAVASIGQQVQNIASHQLPTYAQPYIPGYPYGTYGQGTGFWG